MTSEFSSADTIFNEQIQMGNSSGVLALNSFSDRSAAFAVEPRY